MEGPTPLKMKKAWNGLCSAAADDDDVYRSIDIIVI
jgi:hypothetical protein